MALYLSTSVMSGPPLKSGMIFASFHFVGCSPVFHATVSRAWRAFNASGPPYLYASKGILSVPVAVPFEHVSRALEISSSDGGRVLQGVVCVGLSACAARSSSFFLRSPRCLVLKLFSADLSLEVCSRASCHLYADWRVEGMSCPCLSFTRFGTPFCCLCTSDLSIRHASPAWLERMSFSLTLASMLRRLCVSAWAFTALHACRY